MHWNPWKSFGAGKLAYPREARRFRPSLEALEDRLVPSTINGHTVNLDGSGNLLSWVVPQNQAYDQVMSLAWTWLRDSCPTASNGLKAYYTYSFLDPNTLQPQDHQHNVAGLFAMFTDSLLGYYGYSGDGQAATFVQNILNYDLANGLTPSNYSWSGVPYSTSAPGATQYLGDEAVGGQGYLEPDKVGELGYAFLKAYEFSGNTAYRDEAIRCADALASHVRTGTATSSPWPFVVDAQTNQVLGGTNYDYCADTVAPIKLFDELDRINLGNTGSYQNARQIVDLADELPHEEQRLGQLLRGRRRVHHQYEPVRCAGDGALLAPASAV
jgi:hypothetical protein